MKECDVSVKEWKECECEGMSCEGEGMGYGCGGMEGI